jgi:hypothetical protein
MLDQNPVAVEFTPEAYSALHAVSEEVGKSVSDTLRDALALLKYTHEVQQQGGKVLIRKDGKTTQLLED